MTNANINPINFLQEFCQKYCKTAFPKYFEASSTFESQNQLHFCKCNFVEFTAIQVSTTKKKAKFLAARAIVNLLKDKQYFDKYGCFINRNGDVEFTDELGHGLGSPISLLQEYCQGRRLDRPVYIERTTRSSEFIFECICCDKFTIGNGTSKKSAKRRAAANMCDFLSVEYEKREPLENNPQGNHRPLKKDLDSVQVLSNFCENFGLSKPSYSHLILTDDNIKSYQMFCKCTDIESCGTDQAERVAMELAATNALLTLIEKGFATEMVEYMGEIIDEWSDAPKFALKALCFCYKLMPKLSFKRKSKVFTAVYKVNNFTGIGENESKGKAKSLASKELYEKLLLDKFCMANKSARPVSRQQGSQNDTVLMNGASQGDLNNRNSPVLKEFILPFSDDQGVSH